MSRDKWTRAFAVAAVIGLFATVTAPGAVAAPDCPGGPTETRTLLSGQGTLESVIVDRAGRLFFTNEDSLLRLDSPDGEPRVLTHVSEPGGLAFDDHGNVIVGYGNTAANGAVGDLTGPSGLLRVNPTTGASEVYATGLSMANGLVRGPDGSYYASNDFGSNIDRVRDGQTERGWSHVDSGNGVAIDSSGTYLYVAQTFRPAAIQRVELAHPENVTEYVRAGPEDMTAGLDGMARDDADRLFVAANGAGQIWRVDPNPATICILLRGLPGFPDGPSAVATGSRRGPFPARNLYVVTFNGNLIELVDVAISSKRR
jgi:gluconolactonase